MATCTSAVLTADTGNTPNTSGAFTPASGDLLLGLVLVTATATATATLTSSVGGFTFTQFGRSVWGSGGTESHIYGFVSDALVSSATSQTVTADTGADTGSGTVIWICRIAGITLTGLSAIRQSAVQDNGVGGNTPAPAFAASALTDNPTLGMLGNFSNPAGVTEPGSWTEAGDTGYANPTAGAEVIFRNSGFTGTTVTWGSTSATDFSALIVEVDSSGAAAGQPTMRRWGGTPFLGGQGTGQQGGAAQGGRMWGRRRSGIVVPARCLEQEAA